VFEHVVNMVYVLAILVYYFPFIFTEMFPAMQELGLWDKEPAWMLDTSWKGFVLSPYRMAKEIF
jgi:ABC-type sulfate transport system permease subunit